MADKKFHRILENGKSTMQKKKAFFLNRNKGSNEKNGNEIKIKKKTKVAIAIVLTITLTASGVFIYRNHGRKAMAGEGRVMEAKVEKGNLSQTVEGTGTLASASSQSLKIPTGLKIKKVKVSSGDEVKKGATLATVDETSLLALLAQTQEELDEVNQELSDKSDSSTSKYVKAAVSGRVKKIYASKNESAVDTILKKGALMLISLDGKMSVKMSTSRNLTVGQKVKVKLSSGSSVSGTVTKASDGSCTITVTDQGTKYKDKVTAYTSSGKKIGTGKLYINKEAKVTAVSGTVSSVFVSENETISEGDKILKLKGDFQSEEYLSLAAQKEDLEEKLTSLLKISKNNAITTDRAGIITAIHVSADTESGSSSEESSSSSSNGVTVTKTSSTKTVSNTASLTAFSSREDSDKGANLQSISYTSSQKNLINQTSSEGFCLMSTTTGVENTTTNANDDADRESATQATTESTTQATTESTTQEKATTESNDNIGKTDTSSSSTEKKEKSKSKKKVPTKTNEQKSKPAPSTSKAVGNAGATSRATGSSTGKTAKEGSSGTAQVATKSSSGNASTSGTSSSSSSSNTSDSNTELTEAFSIASGDEMSVCVSVDELDILSIKNGQKATVTFDAIENKEYEGEITSIDKNGTTSNGTTKYSVEITVEKEDSMLLGMNASATITISEENDALLIPASAITEEGNASYVYTQKDSKTGSLSGKTQVETGSTDGSKVVITSGLSEGDTVYYSMQASTSSDNSSDDKQNKQDMKMNGNFGGGQRGGDGGNAGGTPPSGGSPGGNN